MQGEVTGNLSLVTDMVDELSGGEHFSELQSNENIVNVQVIKQQTQI